MHEHSFKFYFLMIYSHGTTAGIFLSWDFKAEYELFMGSLCKVKTLGLKSRSKATCF